MTDANLFKTTRFRRSALAERLAFVLVALPLGIAPYEASAQVVNGSMGAAGRGLDAPIASAGVSNGGGAAAIPASDSLAAPLDSALTFATPSMSLNPPAAIGAQNAPPFAENAAAAAAFSPATRFPTLPSSALLIAPAPHAPSAAVNGHDGTAPGVHGQLAAAVQDIDSARDAGAQAVDKLFTGARNLLGLSEPAPIASSSVNVAGNLDPSTKPLTWGKLAQPDLSNAEPSSYSYLIHALPSRKRLAQILDAEHSAGMDVSASIDLVEHPEMISVKEKISTSLITELHHSTFERRSFGFILKAPRENIVATKKGDLGSAIAVAPGNLEEFYRTMARQHPVLSPSELLADYDGMNEVLLRGTAENGRKVEVAALFAFADAAGNLHLEASEKEDLEFLKEKLQIPLILFNEGNDRMRLRLDMN